MFFYGCWIGPHGAPSAIQVFCLFQIFHSTHHFHFLYISWRKGHPCKTFFMYLLVIGNRRNYSHCLFLVRKAVLFQSNQKWWMVGRWMERNATCDFYCVLFISDFQRTHHFHFLMFTLKRTQKRTQVAKFSK